MTTTFRTLACLLLPLAVSSAEPSPAPAKHGVAIFSDDFNRAELGSEWRISTPTFVIADGVLKATQTHPHSAVGMVKVRRKDVIIEFKFQLGGATVINAVFNDRDFKDGHGGHLARVSLSPSRIYLSADKERLHHDIEEIRKDPKRKAEADKLVVGRHKTILMKLEQRRWYGLAITILGDELRVSLDGKEIGSLTSSGLAHPMKSDFYFAVSGKDALFDDLKIWDAAPTN